ncbi:MAG: metallophosphoesterase [Bernardetiaceae bacterium]|jgi:hypothetical protein|nr:metallophosphoesterase [Bernardetiaceae bacterium]
MNKLKKVLKWSVILGLTYFIFTTLYFGYSDIDSEKGIYKFHWSGLRGIWGSGPFGFRVNEIVETQLDGLDGPYIFGNTNYYVDKASQFQRQEIGSNREVIVETTCAQLPQFTVRLKDSIPLEKDVYEPPSQLIAISDIEGNFTGLYGFLLANRVIDPTGNWIFGDGHLVLNGDFVDRGTQVTQVLWLIYHLENQAITQGGKVHYLLGNHEMMNLYGDVSYADFKYIEVAKRISEQTDWDKALRHLYSDKSELGKWLRSKNIIEKIGPTLFVHAGLNTLHLNGKYQISEMNAISRRYNGIVPTADNLKAERDRPIVSSINSPYWDRRLNFDFKYKAMFMLNGIDAQATTQTELDSILDFYQAKQMVIGHCVVDDIETGYANKVIKIDVKHGQTWQSGNTRGLFMENGLCYNVDDAGHRTKLY